MVKLPIKCPKCGAERYAYNACPCGEGAPPIGLRERCKAMYQQMQTNAMLRQGSPVDDLTAFVASEIGRAASSTLEDSLPLCLYFGNEKDREEFVALIQEAKPGMIAKRWPA